MKATIAFSDEVLALAAHMEMTAAEIAKEALTIAADICVFTNQNIIVEELE